MLQSSLVALGVGTLCAAISALNGAGPIEIPPAPRPAYVALSGTVLDEVVELGPGCFAPMLDELRRHPHWSIRIDDLEWYGFNEGPDKQHAMLVIDGETATWRDGSLPQALTLTGPERRDVLAAFSLDCRHDESRFVCGNGGRHVGVALGEDGTVVATFTDTSPVTVRLRELFDAVRARYLAGRVDDLSGFSLELAGILRTDRDHPGRPIRQPHRFVFPDRDAPYVHLEDQVRLLDWAMAQPASLPPGDRIARGTLRAYGRTRPIAVDLATLDRWTWYSFPELSRWADP